VGNDNPIQNPLDQGDAQERVVIWLTIPAAIILCIVVVVGVLIWGLPADQRDPIKVIRNSPLIAPLLASPTPSPTSTPTPTATITPSPTPNATATRAALNITSTALMFQTTATQAAGWKLVFSDNFDKNSQGWLTGTTDDDYAKMNFQIQNGKYIWDATAHKGFIERVRLNTPSLTDFALSVDAAQVSGTDLAGVGLTFRQDTDGNFYYFAINGHTQRYSLDKWVGGEWSTIIAGTFTSAIQKDKPARIAVLAEGDQFIFFINDQFVAQANDSTIPKGITALAINIGQADLQGTFEFSNIVLRAP
jgi:hypothetical protein